MSYAALRTSLLAARDARQALLDALFPAAHPALLMLSLNLPGDEKGGARAERLFAWGERALCAALPVLLLQRGRDVLGPFALFRSELAAWELKPLAIALESGHPAGRLLDLDVYDACGRPLDRRGLGLAPRRCLLCPEPAVACIHAQRHGYQELMARAGEIIDDL
jgi:holo-ACP synthase